MTCAGFRTCEVGHAMNRSFMPRSIAECLPPLTIRMYSGSVFLFFDAGASLDQKAVWGARSSISASDLGQGDEEDGVARASSDARCEETTDDIVAPLCKVGGPDGGCEQAAVLGENVLPACRAAAAGSVGSHETLEAGSGSDPRRTSGGHPSWSKISFQPIANSS
mmetsp:Transcript_110861/g.345530  ORF Transcript_110861/g.345530 Transcript_110861/m.345530 type:complete len:165 (+) Transcript_110861:431-925(+)